MEPVIVENYDGENGYIGENKLTVVSLKNKEYLVPDTRSLEWSDFVNEHAELRLAYLIISTDSKEARAKATEVKDRHTLSDLKSLLERKLRSSN